MSHWQRYSAYALGIVLAFSWGLIFSSLGFTPSAVIDPLPACSANDTACGVILAANETARVAWWTRLDALASLFTGAAAVFAYLAYKQARRHADIAEDEIQETRLQTLHASEAVQSQRDQAAAASRALLLIEGASLGRTNLALLAGGVLTFSCDLRNVGGTPALDCRTFIGGTITLNSGEIARLHVKEHWKDILAIEGGASNHTFVRSQLHVNGQELRGDLLRYFLKEAATVELAVLSQWQDVHGYLLEQGWSIEFEFEKDEFKADIMMAKRLLSIEFSANHSIC